MRADEYDPVLGRRLVLSEEKIHDAIVPVGRIDAINLDELLRLRRRGRNVAAAVGIGGEFFAGLESIGLRRRGEALLLETLRHTRRRRASAGTLDVGSRRRRHVGTTSFMLPRSLLTLLLLLAVSALLLLLLLVLAAAIFLEEFEGGVVLRGVLELLDRFGSVGLLFLKAVG